MLRLNRPRFSVAEFRGEFRYLWVCLYQAKYLALALPIGRFDGEEFFDGPIDGLRAFYDGFNNVRREEAQVDHFADIGGGADFLLISDFSDSAFLTGYELFVPEEATNDCFHQLLVPTRGSATDNHFAAIVGCG